jgi:solute carrier family 45, member 1/2/4
LTVILAIFALYLVDFSINAVQALDRALIVDTLPSSQQASGNAWAAGMLGFGSVFGFLLYCPTLFSQFEWVLMLFIYDLSGAVSLPTIFPFFGTTELEILSVLVSFFLLSGQLLMAICVKERVLLESNDDVSDTHT